MVTKLQYYSELSEHATMQLTKSRENWTAYLDTASRLYKYPFDEQVMIFAQRPDATACASLEVWNKPMNRYVKRGSKGIALIDTVGGKHRLKYVFDVSDTQDGRINSKKPFVWEMKQEHEATVIEALAKSYGDIRGNISDIFYNIATELAMDYYNNNAREISFSIEGSYLEDYEEYNVGVAFREALTVSTAYSLMVRCGLDPNDFFEDEDFQCIFDFNTFDIINALGTAVSTLNEQVLRDIEVTIKNYERQKSVERSIPHGELDIHSTRGLSDTQHSLAGAGGRTDRQIRADAPRLSNETQANILQFPETPRETVPSPTGDRQSSEQPTGAINVGTNREVSGTGQSDRPDGLGGAYEQPESSSGRSDIERADIQLENQEQGAKNETAPFSMAELAQLHSNWNEYLINGVKRDETVINAALNSDMENTLIEIESAVKSLHFAISQDIINSTTIKNKSGLLEELENYLTKDRKPPLTEQLYIAVISSEVYKSRQETADITAPTTSSAENGPQFGVNFSGVKNNPSLSEVVEKSGISLNTVDTILRDGGSNSNSVLRIVAHYMKGKTTADNVEFLKQEYKTGSKGLRINNQRMSAWFDETGILIGEGPSSLQAIRSVHLSWEQIAVRIKELLDNGQYISQDLLDDAIPYDIKELSEKLWYLHQDIDNEKEIDFFVDESIFDGGFPDSTARIANLLKQPEQLSSITNSVQTFCESYEQDRSILRFHFHKPLQILQRLSDLQIEPIKFKAQAIPVVDYKPFITDDEIEGYLARGSNVSEGKYRIFSFFLHEHSLQEKANFLSNEYGTGGSTHALFGADGSYVESSGKGLTLSIGSISEPTDKVTLQWNKVARHIDELINTGRYMTQTQLDGIPAYEKRILVREIANFFYNLPNDMPRPFENVNGFYDENTIQHLREQLDNPEQTAEILAMMKPIVVATHENDRYFKQRQKAFQDLTAYQNGTFTLFPQLAYIQKSDIALTSSTQTLFEDMPVQASEQITLFPTEQEQRETIAQAEEVALENEAAFFISQDYIDNAIRVWNGNLESKLRVAEYMQENGRARIAADFLKGEFGGALPAFNVTKGELEQTLPWAKVQRRIAQLMNVGQFLSADEQSLANNRENEVLDYHTQDGVVKDVSEQHSEQELHDEVVAQPASEVSTSNEQSEIIEPLKNPPPVFFVDWKDAQFDFDLHLYSDGDIIGYNKDGVEYALGRSGTLTYITNTTMINPFGDILGDSDIPRNIREQMVAYRNGDLYDEQVRENYLSVLNAFIAQIESVTTEIPVAETSATEVTQQSELSPYQHYLLAKAEYPDHVIMTQVGDFYEFYGTDAQFTADKLGFTLTNKMIDGERIPLVGIPLYNTEIVVSRLDEQNRSVILIDTDGNITEIPATGEEFLGIDFQSVKNELEHHERDNDTTVVDEMIGTTLDSNGHSKQKPTNFRIFDDHLGEGGAKTKYGYNVKAIRTLKQIEAENRLATTDEQAILSRYVGWGGIPQAFDKDNGGWQKVYSELKSLLYDTEYEMARASTLNSHYTSPVVIKAIYETVERMGFKTGNILEPACGVGNFFGLLPDSMSQSKLYGVELDSITGRIAKQLYQKADITISGFEKTQTPDSFFDLAIGNVPFGGYGVVDKKYDKHNFLIHDYFFAKTLDQVRPGGVVAFITSKGTLDKQNPEVRKYIAQRAELLGAVRLPNNAFLKNAGTEVTSDILFFQKRDRLIDIQPDWVHLSTTDDGVPINSYFAEHPEMVLGTMAYEDMMYGNRQETTCKPIPDANLAEQLKTALANIQGTITEVELDDVGEISNKAIPAEPHVKNFSYTLVDDTVYFRENSLMYPVDQPKTTLERIKGMIALRDCVHTLIDYQLHDYSEVDIAKQQTELNRLYDDFTAKYGLINSRGNSLAFSSDSAYYLLSSLEILDENSELERKADMFTKRTIKQKAVISSVDTASEALAVSIAERAKVDLTYMQQLCQLPMDEMIKDLSGVIFKIPKQGEPTWITADEYLSGNVREKLAIARQYSQEYPEFEVNVKALEMAQPKDLDASEISVRLGSTWIDKEYVQQFMYELLQTPYNLKGVIGVNYSERTGEWGVSGTSRVPYNNVLANVTYGTERINAYEIIRETLNLKDVRIYDTVSDADGKERRVLNKQQTTLAQQKQEAIKQEFKDWIFKNPERRQTLVKLYNERFNSVRPREYDGSHINFAGISPEIKLRQHQVNAIAHILYGGNTLLAHEVGAGKTFEMVAAAMESKRLGLCQKSLFAVPNHLTEQWASEFLRLYPSANILVATAKDFETKNRRKFCAKIATGDFDAVIIGHSQLEKIPMSKERQERLLREQIDEITEGINELKENHGERFSIKQLEKTKKSLEARLEKLNDGSRKDSVVTFEQLGVDRLFVDEAHSFKNLFLFTKMRNVAGISQTEAQKSSDLFLKCRYMDELTDNKGTIFATGTPEYTLQLLDKSR